MKLYFTPEACSMAPHIVLRELNIPFQLIQVDHATKTTSAGEDYWSINPHGYIAALMLDNGEVLTESSTILEFLADLIPAAGLAPPPDSWQRVRLREYLSFLSCELNCAMSPLFRDIPQQVRDQIFTRLFRRVDSLNQTLSQHPYLLGEAFSVADAYLYTLLRWLNWFSIDLVRWPALAAYQERIGARPCAQAALAAELNGKSPRTH
ncbi:glutathione binding-like protein [Pseudomonas sp. NPDC087814]|uniref:glutathione binding-like protein n=1 Tax=Pseudomonas sp. NPDC087814 TaxID=3364450 RepID=UPI0038251118